MFSGRIGRFPIWAVAIMLSALMIVGFVVWKRVRAGHVAAADDIPSEDPGESVAGIPTGAFADQISDGFPQNVSLAPSPGKPGSNAAWLIAAEDFLVGLGKAPLDVQRALQGYLAGQSLSTDQQALVSLAIGNPNLSLPPEGVVLAPVPAAGGNPPSVSPDYVSAPANTNLYDWSDQYGGFVKLFGMYKFDPTALNPSLRSQMSWDNSTPKIPTFKAATSVRVR
jgi:hypothetical protein